MSDRDDFEVYWRENVNVDAFPLDRTRYPMTADEDQQYLCHETNRAWFAFQAARQTSEAEVAPYVVGNSYQMQNGEWVRFVNVHNEGTSYETMEGEAGVNRYTNRPGDYGRVTGSPHDYSDPRNTPPLYTRPPARVPEGWNVYLHEDGVTLEGNPMRGADYAFEQFYPYALGGNDGAVAFFLHALLTHQPSMQTDHAASEIDPFWICDICKKRERLDNEDWCGVCKDEFYDSELHDAESSSIPDQPSAERVPEKCPECGSDHLKWTCNQVSTAQVPDGRLRLHEIDTLFVLGCEFCSETVRTMKGDEVAAALLFQ